MEATKLELEGECEECGCEFECECGGRYLCVRHVSVSERGVVVISV